MGRVVYPNSGIGELECRDKQQRLDDRGMDQTCGREYPEAFGGMERWVCFGAHFWIAEPWLILQGGTVWKP